GAGRNALACRPPRRQCAPDLLAGIPVAALDAPVPHRVIQVSEVQLASYGLWQHPVGCIYPPRWGVATRDRGLGSLTTRRRRGTGTSKPGADSLAGDCPVA